MSTLPQTFVIIEPRELKFDNVKINESYSQTIHLQNTLSYPVDIEVKPGNSFRYKLSETNITLKSNETKYIDVQLCLTKPISAKSLKIKDIFYIKADFFNDHISSSINLAEYVNPNGHTFCFNDDADYAHPNEHNDDQQYNPITARNLDDIKSDTRTERENKKLKDHIINLENNASEMKIELDYLRNIKSQINAAIPDLETIVDATIGKERALNEVRNKKVLHILQSKDEEIENLKEISKNYYGVQASLQVLQQKYVDLNQAFTESQNENNNLKLKLSEHKQEILKLNDKISSYSQQSQFQKKVVRERDLRIKELTNDIEQTQNMLQKTTKTMKLSYNEQIKELQSKLDESNKTIQDLKNSFKEKELKHKNDLISLKETTKENKLLNQYKDDREKAFEKDLEDIKKEINNPLNVKKDHHEQINYLQIELAKLRSFVRLGLFNNNENIINYQKGKNLNKEIMNELARKSAHLSASQAIIQQQRDRISELEKLQKMSNESIFEQSLKLNETSKRLTNNSSEKQRLLNVHKRQIEILNKKLSDSIHCEEQTKLKLQSLRKKLNISETEYINKIEELEEALKAINTMHQKTKRSQHKTGLTKSISPNNNENISHIIELENKLSQTQNDLRAVHQKLNKEMNQRQLDIKHNNIKTLNNKKLYEKEINRLKSMIEQLQSNQPHLRNDDNIHRIMELNKELGQSEKLRNEYLTELQILKSQFEETQRLNQDKEQKHNESIMNNNGRTMNRDQLLLEINEKCYQQNEEIQQLELMLNAAITV